MNRRSILLASTLVGAWAFASAAAAQTTDTAGAAETVIVTGDRLPQDVVPMKATYTESTISEETILNQSPGPATTVQTLLNTQPSVYATSGGPGGMNTQIKFRAFSDGQFGETFAGIPLNDLFNSGVTDAGSAQAGLNNNVLLTPRDLETVQIYRGVNNPAVNTYNSLGGTINFLPRQPTDTMGGDVGVDGGSFDSIDYHATLNTGDWNGVKQTVSFERDFSSGWLQNTPDANENIYYAGDADLGSHMQAFSYFVYNHNKGDVPQDIPVNLINQNGWDYQWPVSTYNRTSSDQNFRGIVGFKSDVASFITVEDEVYGGDNNSRRTSFADPNYSGPYYLKDAGESYPFWQSYAPPTLYNPADVFGSAMAGTAYHFYGYNVASYGDRAQATFDLPFNKITAGGDFNVGEAHSREYWYGSYHMPAIPGYNDAWDEHQTRQMWSAYVQDDIHFWDDRIHITPGVKYVGASSKDNDALGFYYVPPGSLHSDAHFLSPTLGASAELVPDFTLYAAYGKNVKFPDITSLYNELGYGGAVPAATAQPEYAEDYEIGARYKWDTVQAEVNVYRENFTHIIYNTEPSDAYGATVQKNGGSERYQGVELQLTDDFGEFYVGNWKGYLNASYNSAECTSYTNSSDLVGTSLGTCYPGEALANAPNYLLNTGLTWDHDGWHVDLQGQYVGLQHLGNYSSGVPEAPSSINPGQPTNIPSYFLVNLGIVKVVPITLGPANALRFALHVDNLFDKHYFSQAEANYNYSTSGDDVYGIAGEPRAVYASVGVYF